jgi:hypothetical protein
MARIRSLKPEFWTDSKVVRISAFARLLFQGSWNFALCDLGHLDDDAFALKLKVLPADQVDPDALLEEIVGTGMIRRLAAPDGRTYLRVIHLPDHQKVDSRWASRCPYCSIENASSLGETPASSGEVEGASPSLADTHPNSAQGGIGGEGVVREGIGGEGENAATPPMSPLGAPVDPEPPLKCPRHIDDPSPPRCGACGDARRAHDSWGRRRAKGPPTPVPSRPTCPLHPQHPTGSKPCPQCQAERVPAPSLRRLRDSQEAS